MRWETIQAAHELTVGEIAALIWNTTLDLGLYVSLALLVLAIFDYGFQWWKHEQDLRMSDEEMREEMKMMNGDPQLIARRRAVQRQMVMNRMQSAVPTADAVITNPTELAVAIKYDPQTMRAPIVVAKGAGHVAARIRKMALESGVPVIERKPLAQALFKNVDVGAAVPTEHYGAVAEILRYVYRLKGKKKQNGCFPFQEVILPDPPLLVCNILWVTLMAKHFPPNKLLRYTSNMEKTFMPALCLII